MERNSLQQAEWETFRRVAASGTDSRVSGETQRLYLAYRENLDGERLQSRVQISRDVQYSSAWRAYEELRYIPSGVDDLISRGNGPVRLNQRVGAYTDISSPRMGNWVYMLGGYLFQQGVKDYSGWIFAGASWYPHENLTVRMTLQPQYGADWLLWERGISLRRTRRGDWISTFVSTGYPRPVTNCGSNGNGSASMPIRTRCIALLTGVTWCLRPRSFRCCEASRCPTPYSLGLSPRACSACRSGIGSKSVRSRICSWCTGAAASPC